MISPASGFESDENTILLLGKQGEESFSGSKNQIAKEILERIFSEDK